LQHERSTIGLQITLSPEKLLWHHAGLVAVFGRNHGVYGIAGSIGVMVWLNIKRTEGPGLIKGFALWAGGVMVGFMPIILMALLVPGFAVAFLENALHVFEKKTTTIPLPVPWP